MSETAMIEQGALAPRTVADLSRPAQPLAAADQPRSVGNLAAALSLARDRCKPVAKEGYNDWHKYKYASAESILAEAHEALLSTGLALIPVSASTRVSGTGNMAFYERQRKFLLAHSSGELVPLEINWPVCPDKGRPLDKAVAAAETVSLAYLLRDLLQMPRVDPDDDVAARDDRKAASPPAPAAQPQRPPAQQPAKAAPAQQPARRADEPTLTDAQFDALNALIDAKVDPTDRQPFEAALGVVNLATLPARLGELVCLIVNRARVPAHLAENVLAAYGAKSVLDLTPAQATDAVRRLQVPAKAG